MSRSARTAFLLAALITGNALHAQNEPQHDDHQDQQEPTTRNDRDQDESANLDIIRVHATRRSNSIDSVPVAVTAIDGETLEESGVRDLQALQMLSPSLYTTVAGSEAGAGVIRIRGIGTSGISNPGLEPAVGVFVDGVYRPRPGAALGDLVDIAQVEVLRGPQSTLFGKNTSAGAIVVQTRKPEFVPSAEVWGGIGNRNYWIAGSALNAPIIDDRLAMRLTAQVQQKDGFIESTIDDKTFNGRDRWLVRGQLLFTPSANAELRFVVDYAEKEENCCVAPYVEYGPTAPLIQSLGGTIYDSPRSHKVAIDRNVGQTDENMGASVHLDWFFNNGMTLNAILSHRNWEANTFGDADYSDVDLIYYDFNRIDSTFDSAEVTVSGQHGPVDWLLGGFFGTQDTDTEGRLVLGSQAGAYLSALSGGAIPPFLYPADSGHQRSSFFQDADSLSVFTHNEIDLGRDWTLTLGARYLDESKDGGGVVVSDSPSCVVDGIPPALQVLCPSPAFSTSYDDNEVVGTLGISKSFGPSSFAYLSYSRGYKAGGINLAPSASLGGNTNFSFDPELVDSYELGWKQGFMNNRLNLRSALFYLEYEDFQLNAFDGISFNISNAASVTSKGVEIEAEYRLGNSLQVRGGVTYNDATFGHDTITENLRGKQVTNAPEWSGMAGVYYQKPVDAWNASVFGNLVLRAQSEANTGADLDPNKRQAGYALLNARLGLRFDSNWDVAIWGNNLTDRDYSMVIIDSVVQQGSYNGFKGETRSFGITFGKTFF